MNIHILMSTYNGARFLREQLDSICRQTVQEWRLLIRDDGSTDETLDIIREYSQRDQRIHWINPDRRNNVGVIKSFFELVKAEPADVYFFSDQDDVWLPEKIEKTLEVAGHYSLDEPLLVYTDLTVVDAQLRLLKRSMIQSQSHHANTQLIQELTENTVTGGTMMINHALADCWTVDQDILMHDWFLALLAATLGQLVYLPYATQLYRQHGDNVLGARTWSKRLRNWAFPTRLIANYWKLIKGSQKQATFLLPLSLSDEQRELVCDYVQLMRGSFFERWKRLRRHSFAKNKRFHTIIFRLLVLTKFAYKEDA